ncbi:Glycosyltransferase AglG [uncultured archaeon]|nr:Glycosyltransferase AglG [uncultured archaeon]
MKRVAGGFLGADGMADTPLVSVVMSVYNGERYIREAIDSILNQTLGDFELIVVDDVSTDGTPRILEEYSRKDSRIKVVTHVGKSALDSSRNSGIKIARGRYLAVMDSDDVSRPNRLETQVKYFTEHPDVSVVSACVEYIDEEGNPLCAQHGVSLAWKPGFVFNNSCAMFRVDVLRAAGGYDSGFSFGGDFVLFQRIRWGGGGVVVLPDVLLRYRIHALGYSIRAKRSPKDARDFALFCQASVCLTYGNHFEARKRLDVLISREPANITYRLYYLLSFMPTYLTGPLMRDFKPFIKGGSTSMVVKKREND